VLTEAVAVHRITLLTRIARLLLTMIPSERGYKLHEEPAPYYTSADADDLLTTIPMP
jgi:hypothetical protein